MSEIKVFPPPEGMKPNIFITVKVPKYIINDMLPSSVEEIKHAIFSIAEQEINMHTIFNCKVEVIMEEKKI